MMDNSIKTIDGFRIEKTIRALNKNNIAGIYVPAVADVVPAVQKLLDEGDAVAFGGSMSLYESGVIDHLRSGRYRLLDRDNPALSHEQVQEIQRQSFCADAYLCSANAVTENGEIYNVDGRGNRAAATIYGPKSVIMVVGCNKLVCDLEEAVRRVKKIAAPANAVRLGRDTYCAHKGECMSLAVKASGMTDGCNSPGRICAQYTVLGWQLQKERIKVLLVGEALGY